MSMLQLLATMGSAQVGTDQQFLRPVGDDGQTSFRQVPTGGSRWTKIDDVTPDDDSTYIWQDAGSAITANLDIELTNSGVETPHPNQDVVVLFRQKFTDALILGTGNGWSASLYQGDPSSGGSLVAAMWTNDQGPPNGTYVNLSDTLSAPEKALITDWNDLWIRLQADFDYSGFQKEWRLTQVFLRIDPL